MRFETKVVNLKLVNQHGATNTPVYLNNSFAYDSAKELSDVFQNKKPGYLYSRVNNPTLRNIEKKLAKLEQGRDAVVTASGMAAINVATMNILKQGDEFVASSSLFGGTYNLFNSYRQYGIEAKFSQGIEKKDIAEEISDKTKFVFVETIGNPRLDIPDLPEIAKLCHNNKIPLIVDNTMGTPALINPIELGADLVIHSTSKYINGMSNAIGGVIVDSGNFDWSSLDTFSDYKRHQHLAFLAKLRQETLRNFGSCSNPLNSFLNEMGLSTLALRMERHSENALELAKFLANHPQIENVNYPGLADNKYYQRGQKLFSGGFGGILTIRTGSKEKAYQLINQLEYFYNLANLGDVKSLIIHPASTIYSSNSKQERERLGIYDDLLRINVGIESIEDLKEDFQQALGGFEND